MDTVSDSDGENSLPTLSADTIDVSSLRRIFTYLSAETKHRLKTEIKGTAFEEVYEQAEKTPPSSPERITIPTSSSPKDFSIMEIPPALGSLNAVEEPRASEPSEALNAQEAPHSLVSNTLDAAPASMPFAGQRSLRKRTFASRHPYIADQADYLGICTVDSINEMFSENDDLPSVARVLNQLYLKRKKRYPDEERYKARNFYAHLGKSKAMALAGDPDAETLESQQDILSSQPDYIPEDNEDEDLIPYEVMDQHKAPPKVYDSASNSEEESDSEEDGEMSHYSNLLPSESTLHPALRVYKSKMQAKRQERPRKGLAIRKMTSSNSSKQSSTFPSEFVDSNETLEEYVPRNLSLHQPQITSFHSDLSDILPSLSSSDYESEAESDLFSDVGAADTTKSSDNFEPQQGLLPYSEYDGAAEEADHINHLFASSYASRKHKVSRPSSASKRQRLDHNRSSPQPSTLSASRKSKSGTIKIRISRPKSSETSRKSRRSPSGVTRKAKTAQPLNNVQVNASRLNQKQGVLSINVDSESDKENKSPKKRIASRPVRDKHFLVTTAIEVESLTKFVRSHSYGFPTPSAFLDPSRSLSLQDNLFAGSDSVLAFPNIQRIHSIGDGYIFFPHRDTVSITLIGKNYFFGLFRQDDSSVQLSKLLLHLQKLVTSSRAQTEGSIRTEMKTALRGLISWILILRQPIGKAIWRALYEILDDLAKLQTKELRRQQTFFFSHFLLVYYIAVQLEESAGDGGMPKLRLDFERFCSDYWSTLLRSYDAVDFSTALKAERPSELTESLCIMYFMFGMKKDIWWPAITEALQDLNPLIDSCFETMNATYALASMCPSIKYSWSPFITILNSFQSGAYTDAYHDFIDVCELLHKNLDWPFEEKLILTLYSSFAARKFVNFDGETAVPTSLSIIQSRHDIPDDTVFGRFLGFVYDFISDLSERKEVKRLITKLVASSQYHYQRGRKFQIMFINRLNLILLLFQISDVDLTGPLSTLIDQIIEFKDMFIYSRAVDALDTFFEASEKKQMKVPVVAFRELLSSFCASYDKLHGMPTLLSKLIECGLRMIKISDIPRALEFLKAIDLNSIPDSSRLRVLNHSLRLAENMRALGHPNKSVSDAINVLIKSNISFLSAQMNRLPVPDPRKDKELESVIEYAIQLWIHLAHANETQNWNFMMLQKFLYLGNENSRRRFALYFCWVYLNQGEVTHSVIFEMDKILGRSLISRDASHYCSMLYKSLSKKVSSLMFCRSPPAPTTGQGQAHGISILSNMFNRLSSTNAMANSEKVVMISDLAKELESEYDAHYDDPQTIEYLIRIVGLMSGSCLRLLSDVDEFWAVSEKLGFPSKRMQSMWAQATNDERLSMLNIELITALKFGKDYMKTLDKWITSSNSRLLYALLEVYVDAASKHEIYWTHTLHLITYVRLRITNCALDVVDRSFLKFSQLLLAIASVARVERERAYIIEQIATLQSCIEILRMGIYIYDGYEERQDHLENIKKFKDLTFQPKAGLENRLFTDLTLNRLKGCDSGPYIPLSSHEHEDYILALTEFKKSLESICNLSEMKIQEPPEELAKRGESRLLDLNDITF